MGDSSCSISSKQRRTFSSMSSSEGKEANVLLIGSGGVGTIVAYGIDYVGKSRLDIVVRRDYDQVSKNGYDIDSCDYGQISNWKPTNIYPSADAAAEEANASGLKYDFIVICTKNLPDVLKLEDVVAPLVTDEYTTIVLMQNGFDLARPFFAKFPKNVVVSGVSHIGSHNHNGKVKQTQQDRTYIAYFENPNLDHEIQERNTKRFISIYSNDKNSCGYYPSAKENRYMKLVYNATMNTVCALTGVDTGRLEYSGGLEKISIPAMREVVAVAKADGVDLPANCISNAIHSDDGDWFTPSMAVDVQKGNPIELEVIVGNLLTVARELNVETPTLNLLYELLKVVQFRLKEKQGLVSLPEKRPIHDKFWC